MSITGILASIATILASALGIFKLIQYLSTKTTQQKVQDANAKIDQQMDDFEKTGRPE
jgi:archaellum component FlaF (FlaF/FlaG flagellin family)